MGCRTVFSIIISVTLYPPSGYIFIPQKEGKKQGPGEPVKAPHLIKAFLKLDAGGVNVENVLVNGFLEVIAKPKFVYNGLQ